MPHILVRELAIQDQEGNEHLLQGGWKLFKYIFASNAVHFQLGKTGRSHSKKWCM